MSTDLRPLAGYRRVRLVQCGSCGLVLSPLIPTVGELVAHYEGYSRAPSAGSEISARRRSELVSTFKSYRRTGRILDVGCGVGDLLNHARTQGWETHGTEYTDRAVGICRANGHSMRQGALAASAYPAGWFDVIVYTEVVEHINNHVHEFAEIRALLRPGGLLYITTPNFSSLSRRLLGERWNVIQYPEHLAYFTPSTLASLAARAGFVTRSIRTTGMSVSRFRSSISDRAAEATATPTRSIREDQVLREALELPMLRTVKQSLNGMLSAFSLGDTIKAEFLRGE